MCFCNVLLCTYVLFFGSMFLSMTFKVTVRFAVNLLSQDYFLLVVIFLFIHIFFIVCVEHLEYSSSCKNVLLFLLQVTRQHKIVFNTTDERVMLFLSCLLMDTLWAAALRISPGLLYPREK